MGKYLYSDKGMSRDVLRHVAQYKLTSNITKLTSNLMGNSVATDCSGRDSSMYRQTPWVHIQFCWNKGLNISVIQCPQPQDGNENTNDTVIPPYPRGTRSKTPPRGMPETAVVPYPSHTIFFPVHAHL